MTQSDLDVSTEVWFLRILYFDISGGMAEAMLFSWGVLHLDRLINDVFDFWHAFWSSVRLDKITKFWSSLFNAWANTLRFTIF